MIVSSALMCLALNLYHESRGEPAIGSYGVALVTMNRADQNGGKVCTEVFKPKQFSWTNQVKKTHAGWVIPQSLEPNDKKAWWRARHIAAKTLMGGVGDFTGGSKFYHATFVKPKWSRSMKLVAQIGQHRFYVQKVSQS